MNVLGCSPANAEICVKETEKITFKKFQIPSKMKSQKRSKLLLFSFEFEASRSRNQNNKIETIFFVMALKSLDFTSWH